MKNTNAGWLKAPPVQRMINVNNMGFEKFSPEQEDPMKPKEPESSLIGSVDSGVAGGGGAVTDEAEKLRREPTSEEIEAAWEAIDALLEEHLSYQINEGNSGMIFKLEISEVSPELKEALGTVGVLTESDFVAKVLKVYSPGEAKKEHELQKYAHEIYEEAAEKEGEKNFAIVPRTQFSREISLKNPQTIEDMKKRNIRLGERNEVEVIMMDYVPGTDYATHLLREAIKRATPEEREKINALREFVDSNGELKRWVLNLTYDELLTPELEKVLGYERPELTEDMEKDIQIAEFANAKKLFRFLRNKGFELHPAIFEQVSNTINAFHRENGMAWRDGHHRNIMIDGEVSAPKSSSAGEKQPQAYIIDFGGSTRYAGSYASNKNSIYDVMGVEMRNDDQLIEEMKTLVGAAAGPVREMRSLWEQSVADNEQLTEIREEMISELKKGASMEVVRSAFQRAKEAGWGSHLPDFTLSSLLEIFKKDKKLRRALRPEIMDFFSRAPALRERVKLYFEELESE